MKVIFLPLLLLLFSSQDIISSATRILQTLTKKRALSTCLRLGARGTLHRSNLREFKTSDEFDSAIKKMNRKPGQNTFVFKYMTYNMCNPMEIQKNPELYNKYAWNKRLPRMVKVIEEEKPDIIGFQRVLIHDEH